MSVRFEKEQVRTTAPLIPGGRDETTAHKIGEALTGGKQQTGYLAVRHTKPSTMIGDTDHTRRLISSNSSRTLYAPRC
jgi:hypothetical protein